MSVSAADVSVSLAGQPVLHRLSMSLQPGVFTVVVGPNGAGKTTLMRVLTGDLKPDAGTVSMDGRALNRWRGTDLAQRRAVLPQASHLAFPFTVYEVVALGLPPGGPRARPLDTLARVGLVGYEGRYYQSLSGGEQQRVQLARVLCQVDRPVLQGAARWLFLDEPISSLDIRHQLAILDIAREHADAGGGAFAILHDLNLASLYADRLIVISDGRVAGDGSPAAVLDDDLIEEVFGVRLGVNRVPDAAVPFVLPHGARGRTA